MDLEDIYGKKVSVMPESILAIVEQEDDPNGPYVKIYLQNAGHLYVRASYAAFMKAMEAFYEMRLGMIINKYAVKLLKPEDDVPDPNKTN